MEIVDLQVMKEGSLKMLARNSDYELMLYQSSDKGTTVFARMPEPLAKKEAASSANAAVLNHFFLCIISPFS